MKPVLLEMQAFGPYVEKQTIDFEELGKDGIFLIKGKTGSGKTTIFDAMTFALYGGSSGDEEKQKGGIGRNNLHEWRCRQVGKDVTTFVSFTFIEGGKKYRFTRSLVPKIKNLSDEYSAVQILPDGSEKVLFENPKRDDLNQKTLEIIGLSKEQFRQVVLLPQGQFEKFITAESGDKEKILKKLFNADQWEQYANKLYNAASDRAEALNKMKEQVDHSLEEVSVRTDLVGEDRIESVDSVDKLGEYIKALNESKDAFEKQYVAFNIDEKTAQLEADKELSRKFNDLHKLEALGKGLEEQKPDYDAKRKQQREATSVDSFRVPISEYEAAVKELDNRKESHKKLSEQLPGFEKASGEAEKTLEDYKKDSPVQANTTRIGELSAKIPAYEKLGELKLAADQLYVKCGKSKKALDDAEEECNKAKEEAAGKKAVFDAEDAKAKDYRDRYFSGIYGEIASELKEGIACPVCGSTQHPRLAKKADDSISKDKVDKQEEITKLAREEWDTAEENHNSSEENLKALNTAYNEDNNAYSQAKTAYEKNMESLIDGIEDLESLKKEIDSLGQANQKFEEEVKRLTGMAQKAQSAFEEQKTKIASAKEEVTNAEKDLAGKKDALDKLMNEKGYSNIDEIKSKMMDPESLKDLTTDIASYEQQCSDNKKNTEEAGKALKDKAEPDSSKFEERQVAISEMETSYTEKLTSFKEVLGSMEKKQKELSVLEKEYKDNIAQAEDDLMFATKVRGDSGMGLQRYVLAIMFDQVIGEANRMLAKVHSGRYQLFRTDEKGAGRKNGLELKVYDRRSPDDTDGRNVRMLSGGEKFLVSLSLSIGMSTIAQKAGMKTDSLFIDEGFGTLDETSINDAMEILESVRRNSGVIGIISHVKLLEENIGTQIEVVKSDKGNYVKMC